RGPALFAELDEDAVRPRHDGAEGGAPDLPRGAASAGGGARPLVRGAGRARRRGAGRVAGRGERAEAAAPGAGAVQRPAVAGGDPLAGPPQPRRAARRAAGGGLARPPAGGAGAARAGGRMTEQGAGEDTATRSTRVEAARRAEQVEVEVVVGGVADELPL